MGQDTRELFFSDMRVPVASLLGDKEGLGFYQLMEQPAPERLIIASLCAGVAESAVLEAIRYTKQREAFGRTLIKFQHNRFELAQLKAGTLSIQTTVDHCIQQYIDGNNDPAIAADKTSTGACSSSGLRLHDGVPHRAPATARATKIFGGTSEIMKKIISRSFINQLAAATKPRGPSRYSRVR